MGEDTQSSGAVAPRKVLRVGALASIAAFEALSRVGAGGLSMPAAPGVQAIVSPQEAKNLGLLRRYDYKPGTQSTRELARRVRQRERNARRQASRAGASPSSPASSGAADPSTTSGT